MLFPLPLWFCYREIHVGFLVSLWKPDAENVNETLELQYAFSSYMFTRKCFCLGVGKAYVLVSITVLTKEPGNQFPWNCLVTKLWTFHECSNAFCTGNELKCYMGLTLLCEGLTSFWQCESLDLLLPISSWITETFMFNFLSCSFFAGWAHVVCALYIPEVRFGNVTSMEPIILASVPHDRFCKVPMLNK